MDPFSLGAVALAGYAMYRYSQRGEKHGLWRDAIADAAERLGGRGSPGSRFNDPEIRATVDGITVTVKLQAAHKAPGKRVAVAEAPLSDTDARVYFGWDISQIRKDLTYIPELEFGYSYGLSGDLTLRAEDKDFGRDFVEHSINDIADVRREADAHGLEILIRGGTFRMAVHGVDRNPLVLERLVTATVRLIKGAEWLNGSSDVRPEMTSPQSALTEDFVHAECNLCTERRKVGTPWVRCARCRSTYHETCWYQATGCLTDGCEETRSIPI